MPRVLILCLSIVAVFPGSLAAAPPISEDALVPAEVAAVARELGMDPPRDRARFVPELARLLYTPALGKSPALAALLNPKLLDPALVLTERRMRVPVPLSAEVWGRAIFRRAVKPDQLVVAIMTDRRAALLSYGLAALDDDTLAFLSQHTSIVTRLYDKSAPAFAAFGASLRIRADRVVPPGGESAAPIWEAVVRESLANPDAFVRALFGASEGRLAYLFDTIAQLHAPNAAYALGVWMSDPAARILRFSALVDVSLRSYREWHLETLPFSKPLHDLSILFMRMRVDARGVPVPPASRAFWSEVFARDDLHTDSVTFSHEVSAEAPIDAAWLAETTTGSDMFWRGDRLDQFGFGQRVFAAVPESAWPDAVVAIRAFPKQRALMLTLERMGIEGPAVYATIARQAARVTGGSPNRAFFTLAQLQSALSVVVRMTTVGTVTPAAGQQLVLSLFSLPTEGDRYLGAVAAWLERDLLPLLPPADDIEGRLIAGMAGPSPGPSAPRVVWEGQQYRLDLAAGERRRLQTVRQRQEGYSADLALALYAVARTLASDGLTIEKVRETAALWATLPDRFDKRLNFSQELRAPGVDEPRPAQEWVDKINEELAKSVRNNDVKRAARLQLMMTELVDEVLGDALLSLAYAADLGDPGGAAMLARNVALRHDFGFMRKDADLRARSVWAVPRQDFLPGVPWHVSGSVLGLNIALASLSLNRVSPDRLAEAPRLPSNEREAFAIGVALMNARLLSDRDRDAVTTAIRRGQARVAGMATGAEPFDVVADAISMDPWRRREIFWLLTNDASAIPARFSLVEFMMLGGEAHDANLNAWGTSALQTEGCACTRLTSPDTWRLLSGRPQMAFMASGVPDLNLHIAMMLSDLHVPAALARTVLAAAVQDFIEEVGPTDPNDWWTLARAAREVSQALIEDYVAAAAAVDGPLVPDETEATQEP